MPTMRVFPLSIFDPVHLGIDELGEQVHVDLAERNMLIGGEPGGGKSNALNLICAHGALSADCKLILIDGKQVELGPWRHCADQFIGPSIKAATGAFEDFQATMNTRYDKLLASGARKITRQSGESVYLILIDEYAYFSATVGTKQEREKFAALTRDLVARGRAAGVIVILATQRPSHQVIDPSMRDLFAYRLAFRCTTDSSSDVVLGQGWASEGYTAAEIDPLARGVGWLLSETGTPRRIKAAYLTDTDITDLAAYAASLRGHPLVRAGLSGGKGVPDSIAGHPCVFATFTAPSFGPVHARRMRGKTVLPCRPRRDRKVRRCPHGRDISCPLRHGERDPRLGRALCPDCYDYQAAVLFNAHAGVLWRRFTTYLPRHLARLAGLTQKRLCALVRVRYVKVAEYQARGVIHFHAVIRLDAPATTTSHLQPSSPPRCSATPSPRPPPR